jgi:hypothetical protein
MKATFNAAPSFAAAKPLFSKNTPAQQKQAIEAKQTPSYPPGSANAT